MTDVIDRIDATLGGRCPCGAPPADGSAYCSDACRPTHYARDTTEETAMRWRPDLVAAFDDSDLIELGSQTWYAGRYRAQLFERRSQPDVWHLRLDDGHRFAGCDLPDVGGRQDRVTDELIGRVREMWRRLERELTDPRRTLPDDEDPWVDTFNPTAGPSTSAFTHPWRRLCRECGRHGVPRDGRRIASEAPPSVGSVSAVYGPAPVTDTDERCQLCEHCDATFPGPVLTPTVESHGRHTVLKLSYVANGERYTRSAFVTGHSLATAGDTSALLQTSWDRLEAFLLDQLPPRRTPAPPHPCATYP